MDELVQSTAVKAFPMAGVDDVDIEREEPTHAGCVCGCVAADEVVKDGQRIVDDITCEQGAVLPVEQADAARRVAGKVQDLERPVPQIDRSPSTSRRVGCTGVNEYDWLIAD